MAFLIGTSQIPTNWHKQKLLLKTGTQTRKHNISNEAFDGTTTDAQHRKSHKPEEDTLAQQADIPDLLVVQILQLVTVDMLVDMWELQVHIQVREEESVQQQVDKAGCNPCDHRNYSYRVIDSSSKITAQRVYQTQKPRVTLIVSNYYTLMIAMMTVNSSYSNG